MKDKKIILLLIVIVIVLVVISVIYMNSQKNTDVANINNTNNANQVTQNDNKIQNNITNEILTGDGQDVTVITTEENSETTIKNSEIIKTGDTSDLGESDKAGLNSALKATQLSDLTLEDSKVTTDGLGASGVAAVGARAILNLSNSEVITKGDRSKGILVTKKGQIFADSINIETTGYKSSAIATDMGGGIIEVKNSNIVTDNIDSAGIYATGNVKAENSEFTTKQAEGVCIDGSGEVSLINTIVKAYKKRGVMLYYTGPSDMMEPHGLFKMIGGELTVEEGPAFYIMNTGAEIELDNVNITNKSGVFLIASVDRFGELGQEGPPVTAKGGNVKVTAKNQEINGNFEVDSESTLELNLTENSKLVGAINTENTGKEVNVIIGEGCTWTLTGDCYITNLEVVDDATQINLNGYKIYYIESTIKI